MTQDGQEFGINRLSYAPFDVGGVRLALSYEDMHLFVALCLAHVGAEEEAEARRQYARGEIDAKAMKEGKAHLLSLLAPAVVLRHCRTVAAANDPDNPRAEAHEAAWQTSALHGHLINFSERVGEQPLISDTAGITAAYAEVEVS